MNVRFYEWLHNARTARLVDIIDVPEPLPPTYSLAVPCRPDIMTTAIVEGPTFERVDFSLRENTDGYEYVSTKVVLIESSERAKRTELAELQRIFRTA